MEAGQRPHIPPPPAGNETTPTVAYIPTRNQPEQTTHKDPEVLRRLESESLVKNRIAVPETLTDPHSLVAAMLNWLERRATAGGDRDLGGDDSLPNVEASDATLNHALRIIDPARKAVEAGGYQIKVSRYYWGKATRVYDAEVHHSLSERYSEVKLELTPHFSSTTGSSPCPFPY